MIAERLLGVGSQGHRHARSAERRSGGVIVLSEEASGRDYATEM
jgi:hypothetical protein